MKRTLALVAVMVISCGAAIADDDNKIVSGAKAVGRGLMWGPKKIAGGMKKGMEALGNGAKKVVGKDK